MSFNNQYDETVSMGDWIGSMLLTCIPIVGIIMVFVWAFGGGAKPSKRNFFRAYLLLTAIGVGLAVIGGLIAFGLGAFTMYNLPALSSFN